MIPNDPLYGNQWHFSMLGNLGFELLINRIWDEFDGTGIYVGVYDDGIQINHFDLNNNYDASREVIINGGQLSGNVTASDHTHGTSVAGLIGAKANGQDAVGVAFGSNLTSINIFDPLGPVHLNSTDPAVLNNFFNAISQSTNFDVVNHSWGSSPSFDSNQNLNVTDSFADRLIDTYADVSSNGRSGLGTVILQAAGNENLEANGDGVNASRFTVTVGAIHNDGFTSSYSNFGANLLISAPAGDYPNFRSGLGIVTTDRIGVDGYNLRSNPTIASDFTDDFGGTSAATPLVSGVVSLMLDANAGLGWRDVQNIIALSADHTGSAIGNIAPGVEEDNTWFLNGATNWNGGGMHFSEDYGFGNLNVYAAVRMAEVWSLFGAAQTSANEIVVAPSTFFFNSPIIDFAMSAFDFVVSNTLQAEHVDLTLNFIHSYITDLNIFLKSPAGTEVQLYHDTFGDAAVASSGLTWTFGIEAFRGEDISGTWTLRVEDIEAQNDGTLTSVNFEAFGTAQNTNDTYHYTDEIFSVIGMDASRLALIDSDGGNDWIDASAMTGNLNISLSASLTSTVNGTSFIAISAATTIENIVTGDGSDFIAGNTAANIIHGMRGNDTLDGGAGADTLSGGDGSDTAYYYSSTAGVTVNLAASTGTGGDAQGDTFNSIEYAIGSNTGADGLTGDGALNYLAGFGGDDVIDGGGVAAGNVNLTTYQGDSLDGGAGIDTLSYASSLYTVVVLMDWNSPTSGIAWNGTSGDLMINFENLTGSTQNDVLLGNSVANLINGGAATDSIYGLGGADTFHFDQLQTDVIADFEDGSDHLRFNLATADSFSDFTIYGNGTHLMSVVLNADGSQVIVQGTGSTNVTLTADDFVFV
jgi:subtilisin-like proprotein convertase family protein